MTLKERIPVCEHGDKDSNDVDINNAIERLERHVGYELVYNSGFRCTECNEKAGGSENSPHLRGLAVDIRVVGSSGRYVLIQAALELGFRRIGIGKKFVHLDVDLSLTQEVIWLY